MGSIHASCLRLTSTATAVSAFLLSHWIISQRRGSHVSIRCLCVHKGDITHQINRRGGHYGANSVGDNTLSGHHQHSLPSWQKVGQTFFVEEQAFPLGWTWIQTQSKCIRSMRDNTGRWDHLTSALDADHERVTGFWYQDVPASVLFDIAMLGPDNCQPIRETAAWSAISKAGLSCFAKP